MLSVSEDEQKKQTRSEKARKQRKSKRAPVKRRFFALFFLNFFLLLLFFLPSVFLTSYLGAWNRLENRGYHMILTGDQASLRNEKKNDYVMTICFQYLLLVQVPRVTRYGNSSHAPPYYAQSRLKRLICARSRITLIIWNPSSVTENPFATLNRQLNCLALLISIQARIFMWIWTIWFNFMDKF